MLHRGTSKAARGVRLPDDPRSREFVTEYARLLNLPVVARHKTFNELISVWHQSAEWRALGAGTKREWLRHCSRISTAWGDLEVRGVEPQHVLALRDQWADKPATANNIMRCLSSMLGWSVPRAWRQDNPCREIKPLRGGEGYSPWPWDVIEAARAELPPSYGRPLRWLYTPASALATAFR